MAIKQVTIECAKETVEIYEGVALIVSKIFEAKKLGLSTAAAVAHVSVGAIEPVMAGLQGADLIDDEHKLETPAAMAAHGAGLAKIASAIAAGVKA